MAGLRNTIQRQLVYDAVQMMHNHPTAEDIYQHVIQQHPGISRGTVYRNLGLLAEQGDIRRVTNLNAADRFDFHLDPHYHLHCRICDGVFDVDSSFQVDLLSSIPTTDGFHIEECNIVISGVCKDCQTKEK